MNPRLRKFLPLIVLALSVLLAVAMVKSRSKPRRQSPAALPPLVRVLEVTGQPHRYIVRAQGTVTPRTESALVSEVSGRIIWISPSFSVGSFFEKGDPLLKIDPTDYEAAVTQAAASVAAAKVQLSMEEEEAQVAREEYSDLKPGEVSALALRTPQLQQAKAQLAAAEAALARARRDLQRTRIRAPYAGRIRSKQADLGQYVNPGVVVATIFAVDRAEVRLPMTLQDLSYLDLPLDYEEALQAQENPQDLPAVRLSATIGSHRVSWNGRILRVEGEIDPKTRMIHVIAGVDDPYGRHHEGRIVPLTAGLFVDAEIQGDRTDHAFVLPRGVLRSEDTVLVVDADDRLHLRKVGVLRKGRDEIVVGEGLKDGDRVCLSALDVVTEGMKVRVFGEENGATKQPTGEVLQ